MKKISFVFFLLLSSACQAQDPLVFDLTLGKHELDAPMAQGKYSMRLAGVEVASGLYSGLHIRFVGNDGGREIRFEMILPSTEKFSIYEYWGTDERSSNSLQFKYSAMPQPIVIEPKDYENLKGAKNKFLRPSVGLKKVMSTHLSGLSTSTQMAYITFSDFKLTIEKFSVVKGKLYLDATITGTTDDRFYQTTKGSYTINGKIHLSGVVPGNVDVD